MEKLGNESSGNQSLDGEVLSIQHDALSDFGPEADKASWFYKQRGCSLISKPLHVLLAIPHLQSPPKNKINKAYIMSTSNIFPLKPETTQANAARLYLWRVGHEQLEDNPSLPIAWIGPTKVTTRFEFNTGMVQPQLVTTESNTEPKK